MRGTLFQKDHTKSRVAIIGGGAAGLMAAWLLEHDYAVTLFEKEDRLGGHACSIRVPIDDENCAIIEAGAEFFSTSMFPQLTKLLAILGIPVQEYPLTYTFYNVITGDYVVLPPLQGSEVAWNSFTPSHLFELEHLRHFVNAGQEIVAHRNTSITIDAYVKQIGLPQSFLLKFLYPFFAAAWGCSIIDLKNFAAYDILKWSLKNQPAGMQPTSWYEIVGGTGAYIHALTCQLEHTTLHCSTTITSIASDNATYRITTSDENQYTFDHLIVATNALEAQKLLEDVPQSKNARALLNTVEYFYTTIAVHGDRRLMPQDPAQWSVVNIRFDGENAASTIYKPWHSPVPVFRSWITYPIGLPESNPLPQPLYALKHFYHGKVTPAYFSAQKELARIQGNNNLWFAGIYTYDEDSHNSALVSAIKIAQELAPDSQRLKTIAT